MGKLCDTDAQMGKLLYDELNLGEKARHFWWYNKQRIGVSIFIVLLAFLIVYLGPQPGTSANLRIKFVNTYVEGLEADTNRVETDYEAWLGPENTCVMGFSECELSKGDETDTASKIGKMMFQVANCNLELFFADEFALNKLSSAGYTMNLNLCLESDILERVQERVVFRENLDGELVPMAIDITDTNYVKEMGIQGERVYLAFALNYPNIEVANNYVEYVLFY